MTSSPLFFAFFNLETELVLKVALKLCDRNTNLLHGVAVTDGYCAVSLRFKVKGDAVRRTDLILSAVALADGSSVIKLTVVILGQLCINLLCSLVQFLGQRKNTDLHRSQSRLLAQTV